MGIVWSAEGRSVEECLGSAAAPQREGRPPAQQGRRLAAIPAVPEPSACCVPYLPSLENFELSLLFLFFRFLGRPQGFYVDEDDELEAPLRVTEPPFAPGTFIVRQVGRRAPPAPSSQPAVFWSAALCLPRRAWLYRGLQRG